MCKSVMVAALAALGVSAADAEPVTKTVRVSYADLDLARPEGLKSLDQRVGRAIRQVCRNESSLESNMRERKCQQLASAAAAPKIALVVALGRSRQAGNAMIGSPTS